MSLGELVVNLGVKADTFTVKDFSKALWDVPLSAATAVASLAGVSLSLVGLTQDVMGMTTGLRVFTAETGISDKALQQWQQTAKEAGLGADTATSFITRISQLQAGFKTGYGDMAARQALARMGVSDWSGSAYDMANRIQAAFKSGPVADQMSRFLAAGFNGPQALMFDVPQARRENMRESLTASNEKAIAEFQKALADFNSAVIGHFAPVLEKTIPAMIRLADVLNKVMDFLAYNKTSPVKWGEEARHWFDTVALGYYQGVRTLNYDGGDITFNANGMTSEEAMGQMRAEANELKKLEYLGAIRHFNNQGVP